MHILLALALLMQALTTLAPGRVLCLPTGLTHAHDGSDVCTHGGQLARERGEDDACAGHSHASACIAADEHGTCGCHVHVPLPTGACFGAGWPCRGDRTDAMLLGTLTALACVRDDTAAPAAGHALRAAPRTPVRAHPSGALRAVRLNI